MPIDSRELKRSKRAILDVIEADRPCGQCGYNLRGLPYGGKCPECGQPISGRGRRGHRRFSDNLTDAPMFYLRTLAVGAGMLAFAGIASSICFWYASYTWRIEWAIGAGVASLIWWMGVYIVSAKRSFGENTLRDELLDGPWLRTINRFVHLVWILAAGAWVVAAKVPPPQDEYARAAGYLLGMVGTLGFIPLALMLSAFADWARDTTLSERFKVTAWTMAVSGIIIACGAIAAGVKARGIAVGMLGVAVSISLIILSLAKLVFTWDLLQLARVSFWAVSNNATAAETERRLLNRRELHTQEMADRTAVAIALQDAGPPPELARNVPAASPFETNILDRQKGGVNPYDIEPDTPPRDAKQ